MRTAPRNDHVQIQAGAFRAFVLPENVGKVEEKIAKVKPPIYSIPKTSARDRARVFPAYKPGMSTADYVRLFERENAKLTSTYELTGDHPLNCQPAAQYDPTMPLCVEDANPDYIPSEETPTPKAKTTRRDVKGEQIARLQVALSVCIEQMQQALPLIDCREFSNAIYAARMSLAGK